MAELSPEQQAQISEARSQALATALEAFKKLDVDDNGEIERHEIQSLVASASSNLPNMANASEEKINEFIATFDQDNDGKIQQQEWLDFFGRLFDSLIPQGIQGNQ